MSNPTSNFNWQMPTNTDLVTDLPADFEVFGQAVDTSLADLKGGTTGQILSKATNTDMDFVWITNDQGDITGVTATSPLTGGGTSGAITVGIQDASTSQKGSVQLSDSTSTTSSVLAATPTAVKSAYDLAASAYAPAFTNNLAGAKNKILNSNMSIWQRGTSFAGTTLGAYCADRWGYYRGGSAGGATWTRQSSGLTGIQYSLRAQRDSGNTSTQYLGTWQSIETANSYSFAGQTVVLSFYAKCGANYSATSNALAATVITGTGTDQAIYSFTGSTNAITGTATLTTSWQRFTFSGALSSSLTQIGVQFIGTPTGTAGANDWYEITGVQLEQGSTATPFQIATGNAGSELAACQRYYYRIAPGLANAIIGTGQAVSTTSAGMQFPLKSTLRVSPAVFEYAGCYLGDGVTASLMTSATLSGAGPNNVAVVANVAAGLTQYRPYQFVTLNATDYIAWSAEL